MDTSRWETVQGVFNAVADLDPVPRDEHLSRLCADDPALREQVVAMLTEDTRNDFLHDADLARFARATLLPLQLTSLVETEIGRYRLLRLLGEGGMGVVYLAERTDIGGLVAIKLLRDAWLSPARRQRFLLEQRLLVKLIHPGIARIYDANSTTDGIPWFVMEYADGQPLIDFLRARGGSAREDLLLFRNLCEAVQYAHSRAIIHRDLKPSNILVTTAGEVKLLDFGIAKQSDDTVEGAANTVSGLRMMTPGYAAPEQLTGQTVGVFTDVYALGVLLYQLLTGGIPGEKAALGLAPIPRPSTWARTPADGQPRSRFQLRRREWADLDMLCLKALEREPEDRYRTVDALLRDLNAYLDGRELEARPAIFLYATGKFIRRHRPALTVVGACLLLLTAASILFTVRLAQSRNAALAEAARTAEIQHFTESLFTGGDGSSGPAADLKVTDLLARGQAQAESLRADPTMQADMYETLGEVYQKLGKPSLAEPLLRHALEERQPAAGYSDPQFTESLVAMGLLRREQRRLDEAEHLLRQALAEEARQRSSADDPAPERTLWALGSVLSLRGRYPEAKIALKQAIARNTGKESAQAQLALDLTELGNVDFYLGDNDAAQAANEQALSRNIAVLGEKNPAVAENLNTLGYIAANRGHAADAEQYFRQAISVEETWYGPDNAKVAENLDGFSKVLVQEKKLDEAHDVLERALAIQQHWYGRAHPAVALVLNDLGTLAYLRDQDDEAEQEFREALGIWHGSYGDAHQFVGVSYANLAGVFMDRKDYPQAEAYLRKALAVYAQTLPEASNNTALAHIKLGRVLLREQRPAEAEPESTRGYRYLVAHAAPDDSYLRAARKDLAAIETLLGKPDDAARFRAELQPPPTPQTK